MELRDYQQEAIDRVFEYFPEKSNKLIVSMAVGLGKTVFFSGLANQEIQKTNKKVLLLAHREELLGQAKNKFLKTNNNLKIFIDQGENRLSKENYAKADIITASIQTLGRRGTNRIKLYSPKDFCLVIIDECHRATSTSYIRVFEYFGLSKHPPLPENSQEILQAYENFRKDGKNKDWQDNPHNWNKNCLLLGVTATPMRTKSSESLKFVFDELIYKYDLEKAIKDGWLCDIWYKEAKTKTMIDSISMKQGDYAQNELARKVDTKDRNQFIVGTYKNEAQQGQTIIFTAGKAHSVNLKKEFDLGGIQVEILDSDTSKTEREKIISNFREGRLDIILNTGILTEGVDFPDVRNILLARPTKSLILLIQMSGRGVRLAEGKEYCTIIDFVDNFKNNNPLSLKYVFGIPEGTEISGSIKRKIAEIEESGGGNLSLLTPAKIAEFEVIDRGLLFSAIDYVKNNYIERSKFNWIKIFEDKWFLNLPRKQTIYTKLGYLNFKQSRLIVEKLFGDEWKLSFEYATKEGNGKSDFGIYPDVKELDTRIVGFLIENGISETLVKRTTRWHTDVVSDAQIRYIQLLLNKYSEVANMEIDEQALTTMTKGEAGILINLLQFYEK